MKGTAPRPLWPARVDDTDSSAQAGAEPGPATARQRAAAPDGAAQRGTTPNAMSRITLALLDEYSAASAGGYDPYNTNAGRRAADAWRRKPKRD
jgi:hypothetical protein